MDDRFTFTDAEAAELLACSSSTPGAYDAPTVPVLHELSPVEAAQKALRIGRWSRNTLEVG